MKIRFFNTVEPVTTFYRDLLPFLLGHGFQVEVCLSGAEYRSGRTPLEARLPESAQVTYVSRKGVVPKNRLAKLWVMLAYLWGSIWHSLFSPTDLNFFLTQPPLFSFWGWVLKRLHRQPYVCMVMDLYPDVAIKDGLLSENSWLTKILYRLSRFTLQRADAVVVIGRCTAELLQREGVDTQRIYLIPNWADERLIQPVEPQENLLRQQWGFKPDDFIVLYSGNMGISHNFDTLLAAAAQLKIESRLKFVFVGDGARRVEIEQATERLPNVFLFPFQPLENLSLSLSAGDVHFVSLRSGFEGLVVPSKTYGALMAARPVIYEGLPQGEIARMIQEFQIGAVISPSDVDGLIKALRMCLQNSGQVARQGQIARQIMLEKYHRESALMCYQKLFNNFSS